MKNIRFRFFLETLLIIFLFSRLVSFVSAQGDYASRDFLCDHAETLYEKGNLEEAKQEFKKVLILDPGNTTAMVYLNKMGYTEPVSQEERLNDYIISKNDKILREKDAAVMNLEMQLELNKTQLDKVKQEALNKDQELKQLNDKIKALESVSASEAARHKARLNNLQASLETKSKEASTLTEELKLQAEENFLKTGN